MDISLQQVEYRYQAGTPFERVALKDLSIEIKSGTYMAIIGHTGSGKSTLLQHLNGLLQPTQGKVIIGDREIIAGQKAKNLKEIRRQIGVVFQFPEHQLFEETVERDICFGPMNFGISEEDAKIRAAKALEQVGLSKDVLQKSPFDLSGGQMRRVAIAGVLAMEPKVLVLDEPTAGLDPRGRMEIMDMFYDLHNVHNLTTILVTHHMEDAARYADEIVVLSNGTVVNQGTPEEIFEDAKQLNELQLGVPEVVRFQQLLEQKLGKKFDKVYLTMEQLTKAIAKSLNSGGDHYDG